jgi:sec-independent protein translocase protein TatC
MADEPGAEHLDEQPEEEGGPVKSFLEHLEDLRWVLIKSLAALSVAILICLIGGNNVVQILKYPLTKTKVPYPGTNQVVTVLFGTNRLGVFLLTDAQQGALDLGSNRFVAVRVEPAAIGTNRVLALQVDNTPDLAERGKGLNVDLINLSPASGFFVAFQVALYGGIVLASPFIFYFVVSFVFPALKMKERKYVYRGLAYGLTLFLVGVAFCYFVLMPIALAASQKYSQWLGFSAFQWKADEYISFVCRFMLGMGLGFEMPVVILTFVKIGILNYSILSKARKYMIVINLVLGAVLTTPEVITQLIMFLPLQTLFEITIWIAWYWERQDKQREAAAAAGDGVPGT